ncbi:hypothetical protein MSAN_01511400 [Mycena sanguinolenta]|uniref:Uncharacterized protein n=1 Tax=Mycena sanguinolenta TaxID=230812 RepID=A0A8H6Y6T2_9AGAR|nr:hypothetical protein MSAN_01511400 [Mycena sanguinolenta]
MCKQDELPNSSLRSPTSSLHQRRRGATAPRITRPPTSVSEQKPPRIAVTLRTPVGTAPGRNALPSPRRRRPDAPASRPVAP